MNWFTSDIHLGHKNVIKYCNRPFTSIEEMHEYIIKHWNETVKPEDKIYVLGDFSFSPKWVTELVPKLNGYKILVMGNHDPMFPHYCNRNNTKRERMFDRYIRDGWNEIHLHTTIKLSNGMNVLLSHLPYPTEDAFKYDKRFIQFRPPDQGMFLLHGHSHGCYKKMGRMIDVGIDAHDMKILSEDDVIKLIESKEEFIPSSITEFYKTRKQDEENE